MEPIEVGGGGGGGEVDNSQAISGAVGSLNICVAAGICYMSYSLVFYNLALNCCRQNKFIRASLEFLISLSIPLEFL